MRTTILALAVAAALPVGAAAGPIVTDGAHPVPAVSLRPPMRSAAPRAGTSWESPAASDTPRARTFNRYSGYRMVSRGGSVSNYWSAPKYGIANYGHYGLYEPSAGTRWVRYYDDALLVDQRGRVRDARYAIDFDRYGDRWGRDKRGIPVYVGDGDFQSADRDYAWNDRFERDGEALAYDRDYPYDYPYRGEGAERPDRDRRSGDGYRYDEADRAYADGAYADGEHSDRGYGDRGYGPYPRYGGTIVTETVTTTTSPSTVTYVRRPVKARKRAYRARRR